MMVSNKYRRTRLIAGWVITACAALSWAGQCVAAERTIRYFPSGLIYEYRWKLLEISLAHTENSEEPIRLMPYSEEVTQNRAVALLRSGEIDVIALGTNAEREQSIMPIKIDILHGIIGLRLLVIRPTDQARMSKMDDVSLRTLLTFGLNSQWADLPIMRANGFSVVTSPNDDNLYGMLAAGRFDAFPRGLNEAQRELDEHRGAYPQLMIEQSKALYFPYPVYFWVNKNNVAFGQRIERGLQLSLADGSFRTLFESYHKMEIAEFTKAKRHVIRLENSILPTGTAPPDTNWWWPGGTINR